MAMVNIFLIQYVFLMVIVRVIVFRHVKEGKKYASYTPRDSFINKHLSFVIENSDTYYFSSTVDNDNKM